MEEFIEIINNTDRIPVMVDLNNLLYRAYYVFPPEKFKSSQGLPNGHLFGLCQNLRTLDKKGYEVFLCEDCNCTWRKDLSESYKSNRDNPDRPKFYKDFQRVRDLISNLEHFHTLYSEGYEADDIMFSAAKICSSMNKKCYIFTADKDLMQALDSNVSILHKVTLKENEEVHYNSPEYNEKFPVEACKLPYYRAFKGDTSDNLGIPVKRLPKDLLLDLVDHLYEHHSLKDYTIKKKSHEKWIKQLADNWDIYQTNFKLMKLNSIDFEVLEKSPLDSYKQVCKDYDLFQFYSYVSEISA